MIPDDVFSQEDAARQEFPCITPDRFTANFWVKYSTDDEDFICLSEFPCWESNDCNQHFVELEIQNIGLLYILMDKLGYATEEEIFSWLKENDLKPDIPFNVEVNVRYFKTGYYEEDWDVDINCEVTHEILPDRKG